MASLEIRKSEHAMSKSCKIYELKKNEREDFGDTKNNTPPKMNETSEGITNDSVDDVDKAGIWEQIVMDQIVFANYEINLALGRIRNRKGKMHEPKTDLHGYIKCSLFQDGKRYNFSVHRIVATMAFGSREDNVEVNHIDHNKSNNCRVNLEWITHAENVKKSHQTKNRKSTGKHIVLYEDDHITPRQSYSSIRSAAHELGISEKNIGTVLSGRIKWTRDCTGEHMLHFKYANPRVVPTDEELTEYADFVNTSFVISPRGLVYNTNRKIIMKGRDRGGYLSVMHADTNYFIHRMVAMTFIPNPENKLEVNHKDGDKHNNDVTNLEWMTKPENIQASYDTGLNGNVVAVKRYTMDGTLDQEYKSIADARRALVDLGRDLGRDCEATITACCRYKIKHAYGFIWRYATDTTPVEPISVSERNGQKAVVQYTLDGLKQKEFASVADAAEAMTGNRRNATYISANCKGRREEAHGSVFKFKELTE